VVQEVDIPRMAKYGRKTIVTPALIRKVRALHATGIGTRRVAKEIGISRGTVLKALRTG
jgi:orotate phosphoribosyltransferase-like protein